MDADDAGATEIVGGGTNTRGGGFAGGGFTVMGFNGGDCVGGVFTGTGMALHGTSALFDGSAGGAGGLGTTIDNGRGSGGGGHTTAIGIELGCDTTGAAAVAGRLRPVADELDAGAARERSKRSSKGDADGIAMSSRELYA